MIHKSKTRVSLAAALLVGLATLGSANSASASSSFPAAMQKSLNKLFPDETFCVPLCTACHNTTLGGPRDLNVFGSNLEKYPTFPNLILGNGGDVDTKVENALNNYFASAPPTGLAIAPANFPNPRLPTAPPTFPVGTQPSYDSDGDGVSDYEELRGFDSPSIAFTRGDSAFCPDIAYGCFARIAGAPPPVDRLGLFSAGLVVLGLAAFRRLKRTPRPG